MTDDENKRAAKREMHLNRLEELAISLAGVSRRLTVLYSLAPELGLNQLVESAEKIFVAVHNAKRKLERTPETIDEALKKVTEEKQR